MSKMFSLLFAGFLFIGLAGEVEGEEIARAFTPTKSYDMIHGWAVPPTAPPGTRIEFSVRHGQWFRVDNLDDGSSVAYLPKLLGGEDQSLEIEEFEISPLEGGEQARFTGERFTARFGEELMIPKSGFQLVFERFERRGHQDDSDPSLDDFARRYGTQADCCVSCGGFSYCGCNVVAPCGDCCAGACCPNGGGSESPWISHQN